MMPSHAIGITKNVSQLEIWNKQLLKLYLWPKQIMDHFDSQVLELGRHANMWDS